MQNSALYIAFSLLVMLTSACMKDADHCFTGRGQESTEIRQTAPFEHIWIEGRIDLSIAQDSQFTTTVSYGERVLSGIQTMVRNDTLFISENNACDWMRQTEPLPLVEVSLPSIRSIVSQSAATVSITDTFHCDSLTVEIKDAAGYFHASLKSETFYLVIHTGATDVQVTGSTTNGYIYNGGNAPVYADQLIARRMYVDNNKLGDTYINVWEALRYEISHEGDIYLLGYPEIEKVGDSGNGELIFNP
jgi:hypothetical protein